MNKSLLTLLIGLSATSVFAEAINPESSVASTKSFTASIVQPAEQALYTPVTPSDEVQAKVMSLIKQFSQDVQYYKAPYDLTAVLVTSTNGQKVTGFIDKEAQFLMAGPLLDLNSKEPIHENILKLASGEPIKAKPTPEELGNLLEGIPYTQMGTGEQIIHIVFDANCGYCHSTYQQMENLMLTQSENVQVRWYPVGFLGQDSMDKANRLMGINFEQRTEALSNLMKDRYHNLGKYEYTPNTASVQHLHSFMKDQGLGGVPVVISTVTGAESITPGSPTDAYYANLSTVLGSLAKN